jgi:hypothetical protein
MKASAGILGVPMPRVDGTTEGQRQCALPH